MTNVYEVATIVNVYENATIANAYENFTIVNATIANVFNLIAVCWV